MKRLTVGAALVALMALAVRPGYAQTVVKSTFGPGDSYSAAGEDISEGRWIGESFLYSGPTGVFLSAIRFAGYEDSQAGGGNLTVSFLDGTDINSATLLESWTLSSLPTTSQVNTLSSISHPTLTSGDTYWVELSAVGLHNIYVWNINDQGFTGGFAQTSGSTTFTAIPVAHDEAFDVTVTSPTSPTTTPEPASLVLTLTGIAGVSGIARRRRKRA